jgi:glycerol-3-phosphate dehydrogenase (NAD(P)+)
VSEPTRAIVGAGAWGTTLAVHIGRHTPVVLVAHGEEQANRLRSDGENKRYLPGVPIPPEVQITADPAAIGGASEIVLFAVPAEAMRETAKRAARSVHRDAVLLSVAKGIERGSLRRMTEVIAEEIPDATGRVAAMSGPNLAGEIARRLPASSVVAAEDEAISQRALEIVGSRSFRLYRNRDVIGVELCGALKNIIAIAAGAVDGLGFGDNGKAGLLTRGLAEMTRLGIAAGANPLTFAGLAGLGDVIATCSSPLSRNRRVGEELAKGRSWKEIEGTLPGVAEGAPTPSTRRWRWPSASASRCRSRRKCTTRSSRGRACSVASPTSSRASRRTSWPISRAGSRWSRSASARSAPRGRPCAMATPRGRGGRKRPRKRSPRRSRRSGLGLDHGQAARGSSHWYGRPGALDVTGDLAEARHGVWPKAVVEPGSPALVLDPARLAEHLQVM